MSLVSQVYAVGGGGSGIYMQLATDHLQLFMLTMCACACIRVRARPYVKEVLHI